jgi:hypothetical protein
MNKESTRAVLVAAGLALLLVGLQLFRATADSGGKTDIDAAIEALRSDIRSDKTKIVGKAMDLDPDQAQKFWPIYREFDAEVNRLNDERVALVKSYAEKGGVLSDREARAMADQTFDLQHRRADLNRRYFNRMAKELPAATAARFFQLEHRLDLVVDAKIASELPPVLEGSAPKERP